MKSLRYSNIRYLQRGMTLPELLIVIFLLGIFALSGMHSWHNYQQILRLKESGYQLLAFLTQLQNEANWYNSDIPLWVKKYPPWCIGRGTQVEEECKVGSPGIFTLTYTDILLSDYFRDEKAIFYGRRNNGTPGHITLANSAGEISVILTMQGRLRLCSNDAQRTGMPPCKEVKQKAFIR